MKKLSPMLAALMLLLLLGTGCLGGHRPPRQAPNGSAYALSTDKPEFPVGWPLASIKLPETATKYPISPRVLNKVHEVHYSLVMPEVDAPSAYLVGFQCPLGWQAVRQFFDQEAHAAGLELQPDASREADDPKTDSLQGDISWKKVVWQSQDNSYELQLTYEKSKGNLLFPATDGYYVVLRHL